MSKTSVITTRIDPKLKSNAEQVLAKLGMTTAQAITMFLKQVELNQGLPFMPQLPKQVDTQQREQTQIPDFGIRETPAHITYNRKSILSYGKMGRQRTYPTTEAADEFISQQRDEWER